MRPRKPPTPSLFDLRCSECQAYLLRTVSGYLACPQGHGKLVEELAAEEPCGSLFEPDLPEGFDGGA